MFNLRNLFIGALSFSTVLVHADSTQKLDVLNNCSQSMQVKANNADGGFNVDFNVPAYAKALVVAQITELNVLQEKLFLGVAQNNVSEMIKAINAGADVNKKKDGKALLDWALTLGHGDAVCCLLAHGATK